MNKKSALIVVDVQTALIEGKPYAVIAFIKNLKKLLIAARHQGMEIVFIQHDDGKGTSLERGSEGWKIYHEVYPLQNEVVFDKVYNSAFHQTDLNAYLHSKEIEQIYLCGMQTEYCIDATLKSAFDLGYEIVVPEACNTTFDNEFLKGNRLYEFYNFKIWNNRFAKIIPLDEALCLIQNRE